ncbi:MAG: YecA family protein [Pirellulaceae bacterium]
MAFDHYAPCPCGSGKKIKFCKCIEQPQEYEKIMKLVEGGQHIAVVDRINQLLKKTPNAAWLLALKGEITLAIQEYETFKETADRFNELKPDNPLSLVMKAIACTLENEPVENTARYILAGMSECREGLPALTVTAIKLLMQALAADGKLALVGYWSDIYNTLSGDRPEDDAPGVDPTINLLAKAPTKIIEDSGKVEWKERMAEVVSLSKTFRYSQAEAKLRSILRDFPDQPGPMSYLLRAQCAQLDQSGAYQTAKKLADNLQVSAEDRAYFTAVALEIEPKSRSLQCEMTLRYCEVDSEDEIEQAMLSHSNVEAPDSQAMAEVRNYYGMMVGDEVAAKRIFSVFSEPMNGEGEDSGERVIASSVGSVILFGKQTDKPARVLFIANLFADYQAIVDEVLGLLNLGKDVEGAEVPLENVYSEFLRRPHVIVGNSKDMLTLEERAEQLRNDFLNMPIAVFDGATPKEAADDEKLRASLIGLLYHLEGEQSVVTAGDVVGEIYKDLGIERPVVDIEAEAESLRLPTALDMDRVDVAKLNDSQVRGLTVRSMSMGASRVFYRCAQQVRSRESLKDDAQLQVAAISGLLSMLPSIDERLSLCDEMEEILSKVNAPVGRVVIQKMTMLQAVGREQEAREVLQNGVQKYPQDPYLMSFLQYAMQAQGMQPGGGGGADEGLAMKMMQNAASKQSDGGLVLPGQEPAAPPSASGDGENKLWLPGS